MGQIFLFSLCDIDCLLITTKQILPIKILAYYLHSIKNIQYKV